MRSRLAPAILAAALVTAGCGHTRQAQVSAQPALFAYDRSQPLHYVDHGVVGRKGAVAVHDVSYMSLGQEIDAFLIERPGRAQPAVVFVHGSGGDRNELLGTAVVLAERGVVALTITEPSSAYPSATPRGVAALLAESKATTVRDVVAVRRAADVLTQLIVVDPARVGYLGWSAGAKTGTFIAASDRRFRALALLSAGAERVAAYVAAAPAGQRALIRSGLTAIDPIRAVHTARPGALLLEDGSRDKVIPRRALRNIVLAAPRNTTVRWYPAGHALDNKAYRDALAWLETKLAARR